MDEKIRQLERALKQSGQDVHVVPHELWNHIMSFLQKEMFRLYTTYPKECRYCNRMNTHRKDCRLDILLRALEDARDENG